MKADKFATLRKWMVVHFVVDMVVAVPLFILPGTVLRLVGVEGGEAVARVVAAALFAIGGESFLGRNGGQEGLVAMLGLKIIWSSMAVVGILMAILWREIAVVAGSVLVMIFGGFDLLWVGWWRKIREV